MLRPVRSAPVVSRGTNCDTRHQFESQELSCRGPVDGECVRRPSDVLQERECQVVVVLHGRGYLFAILDVLSFLCE